MIRKLLLPALILMASTALAQISNFEKLDSLSQIISGLAMKTSGMVYKDQKGLIYTLGFPDESFKVYSYDGLATKAVYKKANNREVLALTENIDLSKATGISVGNGHDSVVYIKLDFPQGHLKTQIIENGKLTTEISENYLEFFCRRNLKEGDQFIHDKIFNSLYFLTSHIRLEKGYVTEELLKNEEKDWLKISFKEFFKKYPHSILRAQAERIEKLNTEKKNREFLFSFLEKYQFKPGITLTEFAAISPERKQLAEQKTDKYGIKRVKVQTGNNPVEITVRNNRVTNAHFILTSRKKEIVATVQQIMAEIRKGINEEYISDWRTRYSGTYDFDYYITVPETGVRMSVTSRAGGAVLGISQGQD